jgi:general secretion pathway protein I
MTAFRSHIPLVNTKGFTLLEIMVSIGVLALVMVTLFRLQSSTITLAGLGKFNSSAPFLARRQLAALELELGDPVDLSGDFGDDFQGYEWSCSIEDAEFEEPAIISGHSMENFKKINLKITGPNKDRTYEITTWRYLIEKEDI